MLMLSIKTDDDFVVTHSYYGVLHSDMKFMSNDHEDMLNFVEHCSVADPLYKKRFTQMIVAIRKKIKLYQRGDVQDGNYSIQCEYIEPIFLDQK